jgi:hypothetical protein
MVLKWLGGKVDHPMAEAKQARQIVDELPPGDAAKALEEITYWVETINQTGGFRLDRRFENLDLLDGAAKIPVRKLSQDYLSMPRQLKFQENRLWNTVFGFWKQLGDGYLMCLEQHDGGAAGATAIRKSLPVIVVRSLRMLNLQLKWILLRYGPVEGRVWTEFARLYRLAEQKGFADISVGIYPGAHGTTTAKREFLRAMMLSASSSDGLPPTRQEIAERSVAQFSDAFRLATGPAGCTHCFDLAIPAPPVRLFKGVQPTPTVRFFGAGDGLGALNRLIGQIVASGEVPKDVNLGGAYDKELVLGTLRHLAQYWAEAPPARGSERQQSAGRMTVVPGLPEILQALDPALNDTLDFSQDQPAESWLVENVSDGGYGAIIPAVKSDWIKVGALIGVQSDMSRYWGIGLIRRITRDENNQRRVGIQILSKTAIPVSVARSGTTVSSFNAGREPQPAVLLSTAPDAQGEIALVMREGTFSSRDSLEMTVRDKMYLLLPSRMVEGGEDYDWAKFRVMQRS